MSSMQRLLDEAHRTNEILREEMRERVRSMQATIQTMGEELELKDQELLETKTRLQESENEVASLRAEVLEMGHMIKATARGLERSTDEKTYEIQRLLQTVESLNAELQVSRTRLREAEDQLRLVDLVKRQALQDLAVKDDQLAAMQQQLLTTQSRTTISAPPPSPAKKRELTPTRRVVDLSSESFSKVVDGGGRVSSRPQVKSSTPKAGTRGTSPKRWFADPTNDALLQTYPMHNHPAFATASTSAAAPAPSHHATSSSQPKRAPPRDRTPERIKLGSGQEPAKTLKKATRTGTGTTANTGIYDLDLPSTGLRRHKEEDDKRPRRKGSLEFLKP